LRVCASVALVPRPGLLTLNKIGKPLALSLDSLRREIDKPRFRPVVSVQRTIVRRRNKLDCRVVDCDLDCGCTIRSQEECKKDGAEERTLHVTTPMGFGPIRRRSLIRPLRL